MLEFGQPSFSVFSFAAHSSGSLRYRRWTKRSNPEEVQSSYTPFLFSSRVKMGGQIRNPKNIHCFSLVKRTQWNIDIWGAGCRVSLLGFEYFVHWNLRGNEKIKCTNSNHPRKEIYIEFQCFSTPSLIAYGSSAAACLVFQECATHCTLWGWCHNQPPIRLPKRNDLQFPWLYFHQQLLVISDSLLMQIWISRNRNSSSAQIPR